VPLIRRIPKRGFNSETRKIFQVVNIENLQKIKENTVVTPEVLKEKGLIQNTRGLVKILGTGELKKPLTIKAHSFSKSALEKVKTSGGKTELINV